MAAVGGVPLHPGTQAPVGELSINIPSMEEHYYHRTGKTLPARPKPITRSEEKEKMSSAVSTPSTADTDRLSTGPTSAQRPSSALARGVQIMELGDTKINPEPVPLEELEVLFEEYLSPRKLRDLTGVENLEEVHYLEMKVDTRETSLGNFGTHLPNLSQLKLSNSIITQARDLGSSLTSLKVLWMARCGLHDLDGISSMVNLRELYLAYNEIADISPFHMLESLRVLDLEGNNIDEISQVLYLSNCTNLTHLTLEGNPICVTPSPDAISTNYNYRERVKRAVPSIQLLDDASLEEPKPQPKESEVSERKKASVFEDDWALIDELMQAGMIMETHDVEADISDRPTTSFRPATGYRPGSALKQQAASNLRPGSTRPGSSRPMSSDRPSTARPGSRDDEADMSDASHLTQGTVVCGSISKALRSRGLPQHPVREAAYEHLKKSFNVKPASSSGTVELDSGLQELMDELKEWKEEHRRKRAEIEASKAPQVLRIDHEIEEPFVHDDEYDVESSDDEVQGQGDLESEGHIDHQLVEKPSEPEENEDIEDQASSPIGVRIDSRGNKYSERVNSRGEHYTVFEGARPKVPPISFPSYKGRLRLPQHSNPTPPALQSQHDESFDAGNVEHKSEKKVSFKTDRVRRKSKTDQLEAQQIAGGDLRQSKSRHSTSSIGGASDEHRPVSGPAVPETRPKFRLNQVSDKNVVKGIDPSNPIIRSSITSPERIRPESLRGTTAHVPVLSSSGSGLRAKTFKKVPLLPSKSKLGK